MSDIFREVDEDLRQERYAKLWSRFGKYVVGAVVLVVVVAAIVIAWQNVTEGRRQAEGESFAEALELAREGATEQAATAFNRLAENSGSGYRALARLQAAAALVKAGNTDEAIAVYDRLATDGAVDRILRDLGALLAALHRFDAADSAEMLQRLGPLVLDSNAWRYIIGAGDAGAGGCIRSGDVVAGTDAFLEALVDDPCRSERHSVARGAELSGA